MPFKCLCDLAHRGPHDIARSRKRLCLCGRLPARFLVRAPRRNSLNFEILNYRYWQLRRFRGGGGTQQQQHPQIHYRMEDDGDEQIPGQQEQEAEEQATHDD
jgi:hypothetical protein